MSSVARRARLPRFATWAAAVVAIIGCTATPDPSIRPPSSIPSTPAAPGAVDPDTLTVALPAEPGAFPAAADDAGAALLWDLVHEPLYRLDVRLTPRPALATRTPMLEESGTVWTIPLRSGARFHDGSAVTATDAAASLALAASPNCTFAAEVCSVTRDVLAGAEPAEDGTLRITLRQLHAPFLALVLARLPILPMGEVAASVGRFERRLADIDAGEPAALGERILAATNAEGCLAEAPPASCLLSTYADEAATLLAAAGVAAPDRSLAAEGPSGDEEHAAALLERLQRLAGILAATGTDRTAAALPFLDLATAPVGAGPYRFSGRVPGEVLLERHASYHLGAPGIARVRAVVIPDPAAAVTALRTGDVDWIPDVAPDQVPLLDDAPEARVASHAAFSYRAIVFNVREGRPYASDAARRAFALCLDRDALVDEATGGRAAVAETAVMPDSWAATPARDARDVQGAIALLDGDGWRVADDGIRERDGVRLSSEIAVRPTRTDLVTFARRAAEQLRECGIELTVREGELSGEDLLEQLQWPNRFDTILLARPLGTDPDVDLALYEGSRATSEEEPGETNIGGWSDERFDALLAEGRARVDPERRRPVYADLQRRLAEAVPAYPIWYEPVHAAIARRVRGPGGEIDLTRALYASGLPEWDLDGD